MAVIDAHVHIYPDKIADKAVRSVNSFYGIDGMGDGTVAKLVRGMQESPVTHSIVYSVANKSANVESINNFIAQTVADNQNLIGFATLHQDFENPETEIERIEGMGLKGIKLHPDSQQVNIDDPRLMRIYEIAEGRLPVVMHMGDYRFDYSHPRRLKKVLHAFPKLVVDAAHFGGWSLFDLAVEYLEDENCFLDTSSSLAFIGKRRMKELIDIYGADRILFGSDSPMWSAAEEYAAIADLGLSACDFEAVTWRNAERFLGFEVA